MYKIETTDKENYQEIVNVWEASVRATHDFLKEEDIEYFKPLILKHLFRCCYLKVCQKLR